jgi:hypothetical protein
MRQFAIQSGFADFGVENAELDLIEMAKFLSEHRTLSVKDTKPTNSQNTFTLIDIHGQLSVP